MSKSIVGPWAEDKLDRLRKYLVEYTKIMSKQAWCQEFVYIDAFAGPGTHEVRSKDLHSENVRDWLIDIASHGSNQAEQKRFLAGSPRVALNLATPFTTYVFVEKDPERVAELEKISAEFGSSRKILIRQADCNQYLRDRVALNPKVDWKRYRALVFLDPFGMQVTWDTIVALAGTKGVEIFLNFPVGMAIQRLLKRDPESFTSAQRLKLDGYFGSGDWFDVLYKKTKTLFEDEEVKIEQSGKALVGWYRKRLQSQFSHVSKAALIRNTKHGHLYYLLLAGHNKTGVKIANHILSAGEVIS
ncbi:MAG: three-Cys-motif partner protein TcmP [Gemmataceae bacterium]